MRLRLALYLLETGGDRTNEDPIGFYTSGDLEQSRLSCERQLRSIRRTVPSRQDVVQFLVYRAPNLSGRALLISTTMVYNKPTTATGAMKRSASSMDGPPGWDVAPVSLSGGEYLDHLLTIASL